MRVVELICFALLFIDDLKDGQAQRRKTYNSLMRCILQNPGGSISQIKYSNNDMFVKDGVNSVYSVDKQLKILLNDFCTDVYLKNLFLLLVHFHGNLKFMLLKSHKLLLFLFITGLLKYKTKLNHPMLITYISYIWLKFWRPRRKWNIPSVDNGSLLVKTHLQENNKLC
jgi:hypothetical protein